MIAALEVHGKTMVLMLTRPGCVADFPQPGSLRSGSASSRVQRGPSPPRRMARYFCGPRGGWDRRVTHRHADGAH
ncbi:hypothetical protein RRG08_031325 [Elysia crispata]|uniref:Uncharacterized protein n=1 Tax=Elysia crispata TaxID=231223 RepID=A0AAE0YI31_9GAST|nr:hypothetical protein RRG08_031325 [Elysia crispata]